MNEPQEDPQSSNKLTPSHIASLTVKEPEPERPPAWMVIGVVILVALAAGGWLFYFLSRPAATSEEAATTPGLTRPVFSPVPAITGATPRPALKVVAYGVVTSRTLNLRQSPGTDAPVIASFKSGDILTLAYRNGGWYQTTGGGWVSALYLEVRQTRAEAENYARELGSS